MERLPTSTRLRFALCFVLLVASTSTLAGAQEMIARSDSLRVATEELPVSLGRGSQWLPRFGEFATSKGTTTRETQRIDQKGRLLGDKAVTNRNEVSVQYLVMGRESPAVRVRATHSFRADVRRAALSFGHPGSDASDVFEIVRTITAHLVYEDDSASAWDLSTVQRTGRSVPGGYAFEGTARSGARIVRIVRFSVGGPATDMRKEGPIDYWLEENGQQIAAVRFSGASRWTYTKALIVWLPKGGSARERLEWAHSSPR